MPSLITGTILDSAGNARIATGVQFVPVSTPFIIDNLVITTTVQEITTDGSGGISLSLVRGYYNVVVADTDTFTILVPDTDDTYDISGILVKIGDTPIGAAQVVVSLGTILNGISATNTVNTNLSGNTNSPPLVIAVIGAYGDNTLPDQGTVSRVVISASPAAILTLGDNSVNDNYSTDVDNSYSSFTGIEHFYPVPGDADWAIGDSLADFLTFFSYLPSPKRYYQWSPTVDVRFFAIDSNQLEPDGFTPGSVQGLWLQAQLAAATEWCKVVYFANTGYSSETGFTADWMKNWPLAGWGATLVLAGGVREYERHLVDGIPYINCGTGGMALGTFGTTAPTSQFRQAGMYGYTSLEITSYSIKTKFINEAGSIIDPQEFVRPAQNSLFQNVAYNQNKGVTSTPLGLELVFGGGPYKVALNPLTIDRNNEGTVRHLPAVPTRDDALADPTLKKDIVMVGDDPAYIYIYNNQLQDFVKYLDPTDVSNHSSHTQLAVPTFSPTSGTVSNGVTISHADGGASIYYSDEGASFILYTAPLLFASTRARPCWVRAFAIKSGRVDSDIVEAYFPIAPASF